MTDYDKWLCGVWSFSDPQTGFNLTLQPDYRYLQSWHERELQHGGTWKTASHGGAPFLVLTLEQAEPPMDLTLFGWHAPLWGSQKFLPLRTLDRDRIGVYTLELTRSWSITGQAGDVPAPAPQPDKEAQIAEIYRQMRKETAETDAKIGAAKAAQDEAEADAARANRQAMQGAVDAGVQQMLNILRKPVR